MSNYLNALPLANSFINPYKPRPRFFWNFFMKFTVKPLIITTKKDQKSDFENFNSKYRNLGVPYMGQPALNSSFVL